MNKKMLVEQGKVKKVANWVQVSMYRGHLQSREYLLLAVNNAPPPKPVVIKMTQGE